MTSPTYTQLGASTLVRKWVFEVNTGTLLSPTWTTIGGITNSQFNPDAANLEDDSDMQSGGAGSQTKTAGSASAQITVSRKVVAATGNTYDAGQEFVRAKAIGKYGSDNTVQLRISEYTPGGGPRVEAYVGLFAVGWENQGGGNTALDTAQLTFSGQGLCAPITHPYPVTPAAPVITSISPNTGLPASTVGKLVRIVGTGFTGATAVKFGATNATAFDVESDTLIVASTPSITAGSSSVTVQTGAGTSTGVNVTFV